jgi:hypothetical protein
MIASLFPSKRHDKVMLNVSLDGKLAAMRPTPPMRFQKKLVDQISLGYAQPYSHSDMIAKRRWHTDIDRRSLVWKILSGARLSRREEALPVSCES